MTDKQPERQKTDGGTDRQNTISQSHYETGVSDSIQPQQKTASHIHTQSGYT